MRKTLITLLLIVLTLSTAFYLRGHPIIGQKSALIPPAFSASPERTRHAEGRAPATALPSGILYRFERQVDLTLEGKIVPEISLTGSLYFVNLDAHRNRLSIQSENPALQLNFLITLDENSRIRQIQLDPSTLPPLGETRAGWKRIGRDIVDQFYFFENQDSQGPFRARYVEKNPLHFEKTKLRYTEGAYASADILDSHHELTKNNLGEITEVSGKEEIRFEQSTPKLDAHLKYRITRAERSAALPENLAHLTSAAWQDFPRTEAVLDSSEAVDAESLAENTPPLRELLAQLALGNLRSTQDALGLYRSLVKRLNVGGDLSAVKAAAVSLKNSPAELQILIGALASSAQNEAHQVLVDTYRDGNYPAGTREKILNALTATEAPLPKASQDFLNGLASHPTGEAWEKQAALYAVGSAIGKLPLGSSARNSLEKDLTNELAQASNAQDKITALNALGNAGAPTAVPWIKDYISDPNEAIRARAYLALRLVPGRDAEALLNSGATDPSPAVQQAITLALSLRANSL